MTRMLARSAFGATYDLGEQVTSATGSPDLTEFVLFQRSNQRLVVPSVPVNHIRRVFELAVATNRESAWERFVDLVAARASRLTSEERHWLLRQAWAAQSLAYRPAEALARALGLMAEHDADARMFALHGLGLILAGHTSPEVRATAYDAILDAAPEYAPALAKRVANDPHPMVRDVAHAAARFTP